MVSMVGVVMSIILHMRTMTTFVPFVSASLQEVTIMHKQHGH